jgi:Phage anti-repressor protein
MNDIQTATMQTPIEIALGIDENGMTTAKKLYEFLELNPKNYSHWCKRNITENEFAEENVDYWAFVLNDEWGGQATTDYKLTAHFAKKLSCKGNGERAEQAREYFSTLDDKVKEIAINRSQLSRSAQALFGIIESMAKQELEQKRQAEQLNRIEQKQEVISDTFTHTSDNEDFKAWVNRCIAKIAESPNYANGSGRSERYQNVRTESYDRLRQKWNCNLNDRVARAKGRALENKPNITKKELDSINKLSVISEDKSLKPVYETVIKEMMICYCVNIS